VWANDIDPRKAETYRANHGDRHFHLGDIAGVDASQLPSADMAWASFPCQDLSLAGWRQGLSAQRSGTFWAFWRLMHDLSLERRRPPLIVLENVLGLLYGDNLLGLCEALSALDMQFGAVVLDAKNFVPQSRPRVFLVATDFSAGLSGFDCATAPDWTPASLLRAASGLPTDLRSRWRWWNLPAPPPVAHNVANLIEAIPTGTEWHTPEQTAALLSMMDEANARKVQAARRNATPQVGFLYKRIRSGAQRAEVRFDGVAGCLRTPKGGSSRQTVMIASNGEVRTRLLSPREAARLMGAPDTYVLPGGYNDAYRAMGDGVAVPVVEWLSAQLLAPLADFLMESKRPLDAARIKRELLLKVDRRASEWLEARTSGEAIV